MLIGEELKKMTDKYLGSIKKHTYLNQTQLKGWAIFVQEQPLVMFTFRDPHTLYCVPHAL